MLYTLAQMGFHINILQFGVNVIFETMEAGAEISRRAVGKSLPKSAEYINMEEPVSMEF